MTLALRLPPALLRAGIALRPQAAGDGDLAMALYAASRADELAATGWPPAIVAAFVASQFAAQSAHYAAHHPHADRLIVTRSGEPVGRMYVDRTGADWRLLDLVIAPGARGAGIGGALVTALVRAARRERRGVALMVARDNRRAEALYRRLGFVEVAGDHATRKAMRIS